MKTRGESEGCLVFVYGTLQSGQANEAVAASYVQKKWRGRINGRLYHLADRGYPAVLLEEEGVVWGECLQLKNPEKALQVLDALEEYFGEDDTRNEYDRRRCLVCSDDGQEWEAYVYVWPEKKALPRKTIVLPEGRWPAKI
ncbi:gamma-glutamylcyclotransferase family protein [Anaeromusa sp.]|uniref:gamma-glutamylcyclotransferase family protein n=1 Tax=Anaeromusa sp. TaxID=1872520 RepID=UPI0026119DB6|nr:gamma-glutamylcyclotransferase family protein [Anaeromusa sp.]MDD3156540.1 gamma-glutamylcyclotransferase [Anaeromusa sp.]